MAKGPTDRVLCCQAQTFYRGLSWISFIITAAAFLAAIIGVLSWQYNAARGDGAITLSDMKCGEKIDGFSTVVNPWPDADQFNSSEAQRLCSAASIEYHVRFIFNTMLAYPNDA